MGESGADQGRAVATERGDLEHFAVMKNAALIGMRSLESYFHDAPVEDCLRLYNEISPKFIDMAISLESRRQTEKRNEFGCSYCGHIFTGHGSDIYKARRAFPMPDGRTEVAMACQREKCLSAFDDDVSRRTVQVQTGRAG